MAGCHVAVVAGGVVDRAHIPRGGEGLLGSEFVSLVINTSGEGEGSGGGTSEDEPTSMVMQLILH